MHRCLHVHVARWERTTHLHVMVHEDTELVASVIPSRWEEHATPPNAKSVHATLHGRAHKAAVGVIVHAPLKLLHGDHIR